MEPFRRSQAGVMPAGPLPAVLTLDLGAPQDGNRWCVRRVNVAKAQGTVMYEAVANTWALVVVTTPPAQRDTLAPLAGTDLVDAAQQVPNVGTWGRGELLVEAAEHLYVVLVTTDAAVQGLQLAASAIVESWRTDEVY